MDPSHVVDVTLTQITQPYFCSWEYWSSEYHCYGLKYEIVCSLGRPSVIALFGPFKAAAADVTIYRSTIKSMLQNGEKSLGDAAYYHEASVISPLQLDVSKIHQVRHVV